MALSKLIIIFKAFPQERRRVKWQENKTKREEWQNRVLCHNEIEVTFSLSVLAILAG